MKIISGLLVFIALNLLVFGAPWTAVWMVLLAAATVLDRRWLLAALLAVGAVSWSVPLHEYANRTEALAHKRDWSDRDRASVWVLNAGMALAGAALGFPEVAVETAMLAIPGGQRRVFRSRFPARSPRVRAVIDDWKAGLPDPGQRRAELAPRTVRWTRQPTSWREARSGLALDALVLSGTATASSTGWRLEMCGEVAVDYPRDATLPLFVADGRSIVIDEGLFWRLQQEGWLRPYTAVWCWSESA